MRKGTICPNPLTHDDAVLMPSQLQRADDIVTKLGGGADAIAAAIGMVTAEKNTNPFANNNTQNVCGDPTLPATAELRGITPLIDPAVDVNGDAAALSKSSAAKPLTADGLSVFDLMSQAGLGSLVVSQQAAGGAAAGGAAAGGAAAGASAGGNDQQASNQNQNQNQDQAKKGKKNEGNKGQQGTGNANQNANAGSNASCNAGNASQNATATAGTANQASSSSTNSTASAGSSAGAATGGASSIAGADFGKCTPTMIFEGGLNNRPATEFTFQIADPVARGGQQEALNPNIITNALCNQLTNVCGANAAAKAACADGKAQVAAAGTRNKSTADLFNAAVGFAGAVTNPDGGAADVAPKAASQAGKRGMRRGLRL